MRTGHRLTLMFSIYLMLGALTLSGCGAVPVTPAATSDAAPVTGEGSTSLAETETFETHGAVCTAARTELDVDVSCSWDLLGAPGTSSVAHEPSFSDEEWFTSHGTACVLVRSERGLGMSCGWGAVAVADAETEPALAEVERFTNVDGVPCLSARTEYGVAVSCDY